MNDFLSFLDKHGYFLTASIVWPVFSGIINYFFHKKSPEAWVAWSEKNPKLSVVNKILRAAGFDPVKFLEAMKQFIELYAKQIEKKEEIVSHESNQDSEVPAVVIIVDDVKPESTSEPIKKALKVPKSIKKKTPPKPLKSRKN